MYTDKIGDILICMLKLKNNKEYKKKKQLLVLI